jgi:hypothetical protein
MFPMIAAIALFVTFQVARAEDAPGLYLPGASTWDSGSVEVGLGAGTAGIWYNLQASVSVGFVEAAWAPTDRLAVRGRLGAANGTFLGQTSSTFGAGTMEARFLAVSGPKFRLAPWIVAAGTYAAACSPCGMLGIALEAGGERVTFDASVPVVSYAAGGIGLPLPGLELGVRWRFDGGSSVRLGTIGPLPSLNYRREWEIGWFEVGGASLVLVNAVRVGGGWRM